MGEEDGIDVVEPDGQRLDAQLGGGVDQEHAPLVPHDGRSPAPLVSRVG
jgi:hypothetical protein